MEKTAHIEEASVIHSDGISTAGAGPILSVLMPTYRRPDVLQRVLQAYEQQTTSAFELVVVDDGSGDGTAALLRDFVLATALPVSVVLRRRNGGPAHARNSGLPYLRGELVAIVGDDIIPPPDFVASHLAWHRDHPSRDDALLGYVTWPDDPPPTVFMRWLEHAGNAYFFAYDRLGAGEPVGCEYFYTCNVSLKRALLATAGEFDTAFPFASHEDLEFGHRLGQAGMRLHFARDVMAYHAHMLSVAGIDRRIHLMGRSSSLYWQKVADPSGPVWRSLRRVCAAVGRLRATRCLHDKVLAGARDNRAQPLRWRLLLALSYWTGVGAAPPNPDEGEV